MFDVEILIPVADEDGELFAPIDFIAFERAVADRFGSFTVRLDGEIRCYTIELPSIVAGAKLYEIALFAKALFVQTGIDVRYLGQSEYLT